jgi:hypothetical protein
MKNNVSGTNQFVRVMHDTAVERQKEKHCRCA